MTTFAERLHLHAHDLDEDGHDTIGGFVLTVDDGSTSVSPVNTIIISGGTVTDDGGNQATITVTGGGGSLSVDDGGAPVTGVTSITFDGADVGDNGGGSINVTMLTDHVHEVFEFGGDGVEDEYIMMDLVGALIFRIDVFVSGLLLLEGGDYDVDYGGDPDTTITFVDPPIDLSTIHVNITRNQA